MHVYCLSDMCEPLTLMHMAVFGAQCTHSDKYARMSITYKSTRGAQLGLSFEDVVLGGLATDGGLYVPATIPSITPAQLESVGATCGALHNTHMRLRCAQCPSWNSHSRLYLRT
jgi:hypothetical protein